MGTEIGHSFPEGLSGLTILLFLQAPQGFPPSSRRAFLHPKGSSGPHVHSVGLCEWDFCLIPAKLLNSEIADLGSCVGVEGGVRMEARIELSSDMIEEHFLGSRCTGPLGSVSYLLGMCEQV